ncbi:HNH endonuclease [Streptomyces sp. NPDC001817]|uniref:HNH endonuclease n=1 Tax=Streptomyces sp. NPDC001817 TaxID=3154398 RepID=UPI003316C74C
MRHGHPLNSARRRTRKEQLARRHGQRCAYCRRPFTDLSEATLDHVVPCSLWRSWSVTSLMLACVDCNHAKADRLPLSIALLLLAWVDPTQPVVRAVDLPLLARLAAAHGNALTCVTPRVTGVTPGVTVGVTPVTADPTGRQSTPNLHESTPHTAVRSTVRPDCLHAPRSVRVCAGPTGEAVPA